MMINQLQCGEDIYYHYPYKRKSSLSASWLRELETTG